MTGSSHQPHHADWYEIRLQGHLDPRWSGRFDGMSLTQHSDGTTVARGPVVDQAALHGLLTRIRDIGLPLLSVNRVEAEHPQPTTHRDIGLPLLSVNRVEAEHPQPTTHRDNPIGE